MNVSSGQQMEYPRDFSGLGECTWALGHNGNLLSKAIKFHPSIIAVVKFLLPLKFTRSLL